MLQYLSNTNINSIILIIKFVLLQEILLFYNFNHTSGVPRAYGTVFLLITHLKPPYMQIYTIRTPNGQRIHSTYLWSMQIVVKRTSHKYCSFNQTKTP